MATSQNAGPLEWKDSAPAKGERKPGRRSVVIRTDRGQSDCQRVGTKHNITAGGEWKHISHLLSPSHLFFSVNTKDLHKMTHTFYRCNNVHEFYKQVFQFLLLPIILFVSISVSVNELLPYFMSTSNCM